MTDLLISVTSPEEARAALDAGATLIDAKDPRKGALGMLPVATIKAIVAAVAGRAPVSAAVEFSTSLDEIMAVAGTGVDYIKTPIVMDESAAAQLNLLFKSVGSKVKLIALFPADGGPDIDLVPVAAMAGFAGVMLDTTDKSATLLDALEVADLAHFVAAARRAKILIGLAGSLQVVDVGTLLPLRPDILGFRGGICRSGERADVIDPARIRAAAAALKIHGLPREADI